MNTAVIILLYVTDTVCLARDTELIVSSTGPTGCAAVRRLGQGGRDNPKADLGAVVQLHGRVVSGLRDCEETGPLAVARPVLAHSSK